MKAQANPPVPYRQIRTRYTGRAVTVYQAVGDDAASPDRQAGLQDELCYLLNRWDPIRVYDEVLDFPPDEYDCLLAPLLTRLARHDSRAELSEFLWHEIEDHFGLDPVRCGTDTFADRLLAWYAAKPDSCPSR